MLPILIFIYYYILEQSSTLNFLIVFLIVSKLLLWPLAMLRYSRGDLIYFDADYFTYNGNK